jgi:hypothetical protein
VGDCTCTVPEYTKESKHANTNSGQAPGGFPRTLNRLSPGDWGSGSPNTKLRVAAAGGGCADGGAVAAAAHRAGWGETAGL